MPLSRGNQDGGCSLLSTPAIAALKLGWPVARLRYYEARYRDELGCLRLPSGEPLFTDRQLQVLTNLDVWLQKDGTPEALVRERLRALRNWLAEDLPLADVPATVPAATGRINSGPEAPLPDREITPPASTVSPSARVPLEEPPHQSELALLKGQLQDLVERVRGMEETLSALLAYLQAGQAPASSARPVIKRSDAGSGPVQTWKPQDLESESAPGTGLDFGPALSFESDSESELDSKTKPKAKPQMEKELVVTGEKTATPAPPGTSSGVPMPWISPE